MKMDALFGTHPLMDEAMMTLLLDNTHDGMMITAADTSIICVNRVFTQITGYSAAEVTGRVPSILKSGQHDLSFYQAMWAVLASDGQWQGNLLDRRKDGSVYLASLSIFAVHDANGAVSHYACIFNTPGSSGVGISNATAHTPELTQFDSLTALPNCSLIASRINRAMELARCYQHMLAVVVIDLDNFNAINAQHGLITGDLLLLQIAQRLMAFAQPRDIVARIGGDRFALVLAELADLNELEDVAHRLQALISEPIVNGKHQFTLTASLGITSFPSDDKDAETLLSHANRAMFQAKQDGRSRYHIFDPRQDVQAHARRAWLLRFEAALHDNELVLHYQPQVNLRTGKIVGVEALVRWQHPESGLLLPAEFLTQIEQHDLIIDLGKWVVNQALTQIEAWQNQGLDIKVSVNIAARQLLHDDFLGFLRHCLDTHPNVTPDHLELEILETAALENTAQVRKVIEACRAWGIGFALDDFGTGYASLTYLRDIPAEILKIDRSFVRGILDDSDDLTLVEGIISLATAFRRVLIAEGVESAEQGVLLMRLGCEIAQGFGIARPMPASEITCWTQQYHLDSHWAQWADITWEMEDFPLLVAQYDHVRWVKRILHYIDGSTLQLNEAELCDHHECRFGHWYYRHGQARYGHLQVFVALEPVHEAVHQLGIEIVRLHSAGNAALAKSKARHLLTLKDEILMHLAVLQQSVGGRRGGGEGVILRAEPAASHRRLDATTQP